MAETLFPVRQRCKACGKKLGEAVVMGLYDSYECAKMARPKNTPAEAPRECKTERDGRWQWKRRYRSEGEIPDKLSNDRTVSSYWCTHCGNLHIGHSRIDLNAETMTKLGDRDALAEFLKKSRGKATMKQVAEVAGIRPIRIKELEDPKSTSVDIDALFKLLRVYRAGLAVTLRR